MEFLQFRYELLRKSVTDYSCRNSPYYSISRNILYDYRTGSYDSRRLKDPYIPVEEIQAQVLVAISIGAAQSWQGVHWIA